ncbi:MAG TPA: TldD/PmbA family protein [Petrotogaceae bacterium]|nr:TldD/PmbA family protein [Petrotogaceae bacterium]
MKIELSNFLDSSCSKMKEIISILKKNFDYVSVLGTDCHGKQYRVNRKSTGVADSRWNERGFVIRAVKDGFYYEFSTDSITDAVQVADDFSKNSDRAAYFETESFKIKRLPIIEEEKAQADFRGEILLNPDECMASQKILDSMNNIKNTIVAVSEKIINCEVVYEHVNVSKIFVSDKKILSQSYMWSQGYLFVYAAQDDSIKYNYDTFSGLSGMELLNEMGNRCEDTAHTALKLLQSERIKPGEYEILCSPEVAGLIAHEAFGHGVEMDMYVKNRAKSVEYMNKEVASALVTMHDGAASAKHVSSYFFDDEGVLAQDTVIIKNGILINGLCDQVSALELGVIPTGNGKRESFRRKAYTRMTNTFFSKGKDKFEDMVKSIKHGYYLEKEESGMEDPKNWGIQCVVLYAREIKNGRLTDNYVSPVIMTGFVPDLLKSISMVSDDFALSGSGACGKGYKEFVKVSCGGPCIKARAKLG